jgi:hypothetical protein
MKASAFEPRPKRIINFLPEVSMPSPKDGTPRRLVNPAAPRAVEEADVADPGEVEKVKAQQQQLGTGKYADISIKHFKSVGADADAQDVTAWIEVEMVDEENEPVTGERYRVTLPDNSVAEGSLDSEGRARVEGFKPGSCRITFPDLDGEAWEPL